jgi:hypothetical protein
MGRLCREAEIRIVRLVTAVGPPQNYDSLRASSLSALLEDVIPKIYVTTTNYPVYADSTAALSLRAAATLKISARGISFDVQTDDPGSLRRSAIVNCRCCVPPPPSLESGALSRPMIEVERIPWPTNFGQ